MRLIFVLAHYGWWHYTEAIADLVRNYLNIADFIVNYFSLKHLTLNLFVPWRRMSEEYPGTLDISAFFSALVVNFLMRLVGFAVRSVMILAGVAVLLASFILFGLALSVWLVLPFILIFLAILSFRLLAV